jgi:thioredoxin reductase (NADPH)
MEKVVIIGSGPAGLTATLYTARANLNPLLIEGAQRGGIAGGQLMNAGVVENFPGFPLGLDGPELISLMYRQVKNYKVSIVSADVIETDLSARPMKITCSDKTSYETHALIIAAGASALRLPIESEKRFWGKGISACAICDAGLPIFRNRDLAVIGGGDTAAEEALYLTNFTSKVYLIHRRDTLRASKIMQNRVFENSKIEILWNKTVVEFLGREFLSGLRLKDAVTGGITTLEVKGAFEALGYLPNTSFLKDQLELDTAGYVRNRAGITLASVEGVFVAGDIADKKYRQAVTASGSGCMAAMDAERWLQEKGLLG